MNIRYSAKITPDEDTRPECRNVGSWIVTSLGYVDKFLQTRVALYYAYFKFLCFKKNLEISLSSVAKMYIVAARLRNALICQPSN